MAKKKQAKQVKPKVKKEKQIMDGLNMPFDEILKALVDTKENKKE
jgi:hypothetical protein